MSAMTELITQTRITGGMVESLPRVNLMPPEIAEAAQFRKVQAGLAGVLVLAAAGVGLAFMSASSSVTSAEESLATANAQQVSLRADIADLANVRAVYQQVEDAQAMLTTAMGQEVRYSRFLNDLSLSIPDNVWVTETVFDQPAVAPTTPTSGSAAAAEPAVASSVGLGSVTMSGVAFEHDDVANWLESLAEQRGYGSPYLTSSKEALIGDRAIVEWTTTVVLTPEALSGRYTTPAGG